MKNPHRSSHARLLIVISILAGLPSLAQAEAQPLVVTVRQAFETGVPRNFTLIEARSRAHVRLLEEAVLQGRNSERGKADRTEPWLLARADCLLRPKVRVRGYFRDGAREGVLAEAISTQSGWRQILERGGRSSCDVRDMEIRARLRARECGLLGKTETRFGKEGGSDHPSAHYREVIAGKLEAIQIMDGVLDLRRDGVFAEPRQALDQTDKALDLDARVPAAHYTKGLIYMGLGELKPALTEMTTVLDAGPPVVWAFLDRAILWNAFGDPRKALEDIRRFKRLKPGIVESDFHEGKIYLNLSQPERALESFNRVLEKDPDHPEALVLRASVRLALEDPERALADLQRAEAVSSDPSLVHYYRAVALFQLEDFKGSFDEISTSIKLDPGRADAYTHRGRLYMDRKDFHKADLDYTTAIDLSKADYRAFYGRALARWALNNKEAALHDFERAVAFEPESCEFQWVIASSSRLAQGPPETAGTSEDLSAESTGSPQGAGKEDSLAAPGGGEPAPPASTGDPAALPWAEKAMQAAQEGDPAEAVRCASMAISLDPGLPGPYLDRSWAYCHRELFEKAIGDATTAHLIDPKNPVALTNRAYAALRLGRADAALEDCEKALSLDPVNAAAFNNRGLALQLQNKRDEAGKDFRTACDLGLELACKNFVENNGCKGGSIEECIDGLLGKSYAQFQNKEWDAVILTATEILELDPGNEIALCNRAGAYAYKGLIEKAFEDCEKAISINPDCGLAYNNRGWAHELMGRRGEALLDYEISCKLGTELGCGNFKRLK